MRPHLTRSLVGWITFEQMRGFWPRQHGNTTDYLNRVDKHVVSRQIDDPKWRGTTILRGGDELTSQIEELKSRDGADIVLTGSISLAQQLFRLELVGEVRLFVYRVFVGMGRRLFTGEHDIRDLSLAENRSFTGEVVLLRYTR